MIRGRTRVALQTNRMLELNHERREDGESASA